METLDWTTLIVAVMALLGTLWTGRKSWVRSKQPSPVQDAATISGIATEQIKRMDDQYKEVKAELTHLENENRKLHRRIRLLEYEIIRLGGDPGLTLLGTERLEPPFPQSLDDQGVDG